MTPAAQGFLLLTSRLGDPQRHVLSNTKLQTLKQRVRASRMSDPNRELQEEDLLAIGYGPGEAQRILNLLSDTQLLHAYVQQGAKLGCFPITLADTAYPRRLRRVLGWDCPGCLWGKGELSILERPAISLVGSRDILPANRRFAWEVGKQAALQGYTLVSGNARGADRLAQAACLENGGSVICVVADSLGDKVSRERVVYLSEESFDAGFSSQRALRRNRLIHAFGEKTLVAQCGWRTGGTWDGSVKNLRHGWSPLFCYDDGSRGMEALCELGAQRIPQSALSNLAELCPPEMNFWPQDADNRNLQNNS